MAKAKHHELDPELLARVRSAEEWRSALGHLTGRIDALTETVHRLENALDEVEQAVADLLPDQHGDEQEHEGEAHHDHRQVDQ